MIKFVQENAIIEGLGALKAILVELLVQVHMHALLNIHLGHQDDPKIKKWHLSQGFELECVLYE